MWGKIKNPGRGIIIAHIARPAGELKFLKNSQKLLIFPNFPKNPKETKENKLNFPKFLAKYPQKTIKLPKNP